MRLYPPGSGACHEVRRDGGPIDPGGFRVRREDSRRSAPPGSRTSGRAFPRRRSRRREAAADSCRLGRVLGMRMRFAQREVPEHEAERMAELTLQLLHDGMRPAAVRTLESPYSTRVTGACSSPGRDPQVRRAAASVPLLMAALGAAGGSPLVRGQLDRGAAKMPSAPGLTPTGEVAPADHSFRIDDDERASEKPSCSRYAP